MKSKQQHILVISQYFYPENFRVNELCKEWIKRGHRVTVLTGIPNYPEGKFFKGYGIFKRRIQNYDGIEIIRLPIVPRGNNTLMLTLNYISFVFSGFIWQLFTEIKPDRVFVYQLSPILQAFPGLWLSKKQRIPMDTYVLDLWPESFQEVTGIYNKHIYSLLNNLVKIVYNHSTNIFVTSPGFKEHIANKGFSEKKIVYWPQFAESIYAPVLNTRYPNIIKKEYFNITFAGNIGIAQGLGILPRAAEELKKHGEANVRFNIVGNGRFKNELVKLTKKLNVSEMFMFIDSQPQEHIPYIFSASDMSFISLSDSTIFNITLPAKFQSSLACGIPILGSANGTMKHVINQNKIGLCSDSGDVKGLVDNILKIKNMSEKEFSIMKRNTLVYYEENFSKEKLLDKMDNYIGRDEYV